MIGFKLNGAGSSAITVIFHSATVPGSEFSIYRKFGPNSVNTPWPEPKDAT